jgi:hypothetical protein
MSKQILSQELLKEFLDYNQETGIFTWLKSNSNRIKVGDVAGTKHSYGYIVIGICGKPEKAHRLAWLYVYGYLPKKQIDHINEIKHDNRICNLREVTNQVNMLNKSKAQSNSSTKIRGVYSYKNKFCAKFRQKHIGIFDTVEEAEIARLREKERYASRLLWCVHN